MFSKYMRTLGIMSTLLVVACQQTPDALTSVRVEPHFQYLNTPVFADGTAITFKATITSPNDLQQIYTDGHYHYGHFYCPINDQLEAKGSLSFDQHAPNQQTHAPFKHKVLFEICAINDYSQTQCIHQLQQAKTLPEQLNCTITFGKMFGGRKLIAHHIHMDFNQLEHATPSE